MRLRASKKAEEILKNLQSSLHLQPNILIRLAVSMSLNDPEAVDENKVKDSTGLEFNRNTLTGNYDALYKALLTVHANRHLDDDEFFPKHFKAHMERGLELLQDQYQYAGNYSKFVSQLALMGDAI